MSGYRSCLMGLALGAWLAVLVAGCQSSNVASGLNFTPTIHSATYNPATRLLTVIVSDRDGDDLTVSVSEPAGWLVDAKTKTVAKGSGKAVFSWTPPSASSTVTTTISVTDGEIPLPLTTSCELSFIYSPPPPPPPPVISAVTFTQGILTVSVTDANAADVQVSVTVPTGLTVDHPTQTVAGGHGDAVFAWSAAEPHLGGAGTTTISASNGLSSTPVTRTQEITIPLVNAAPVIASAVFDAPTSTLTVVASDADGDDLTVAISLPPGYLADATSKVVTGGNGTVYFTLTGTGTGDATISVSDGIAPPVTTTCTIVIDGIAPPVITNAVWLDNGDGSGTLTVDVVDLFGLDLVLDVTTPAGASVDAAQQTFSGADSAQAVFTYTETTPGAGASGEVVVSADTGVFPPVTRNVQIDLAPHSIGPWPLDADTLYARPENTTVAVGEAVTIYVYTGQPAHPLQFLSSVGFTVETAGAYVPSSFNIGAAGGGRTSTDGYWALMTNPMIPDDNYLDLPSKIPGTPTDIGGGVQRYNFAVVPMGPSDPPAAVGTGTGTLLFNFQLTFSAAGTYHLGFQLNDGSFDQTYYSDAGGNNYFWSVLDNSNTITVQ